MSIRDEVKDALEQFGYKRAQPIVREFGASRYAVELDGHYIGIWDTLKKTFVD